LLWGGVARRAERRGRGADDALAAHPAINWPALGCYYAKIALVLWAYLCLALYLREMAGRWYTLP
ncbi:MAG TPA: hypothetical protein VF771_07310, partial [Longimicrobiaceae bacterium]